MARINFTPDTKAESTTTRGSRFPIAPRGIYTLEVTENSEGETTRGGKNPGTPKTRFTCEIAEGPHRGVRLWHTVTWIPAGKPGHGMAVRFLHACGLTLEGMKSLEEKVFVGKQFRALLEVEPYDKVVDGRTYTNEANVVAQVYHDDEPKELPPPPPPRIGRVTATIIGVVPTARQLDIEEVPF